MSPTNHPLLRSDVLRQLSLDVGRWCSRTKRKQERGSSVSATVRSRNSYEGTVIQSLYLDPIPDRNLGEKMNEANTLICFMHYM